MAAPRKDNVKELILDAAEKLLESRKLSDISLSEIAHTAGISKGTLYYTIKVKTKSCSILRINILMSNGMISYAGRRMPPKTPL